MTTPFEDPNEFPLFAPADADDPIEALTEAVITGDENWIRMLAVEKSTE